MFLNSLNNEQKEAFLDLALFVAHADGEFSDDEKLIVEQYQLEMETSYDPNIKGKKVEDIINCFENKRDRNIVLIELMALVHSDDEFCENEQKLIDYIAKTFSISSEQCEKFENWSKSILSVINEGGALVNS
jgi:tellurite resistance protein